MVSCSAFLNIMHVTACHKLCKVAWYSSHVGCTPSGHTYEINQLARLTMNSHDTQDHTRSCCNVHTIQPTSTFAFFLEERPIKSANNLVTQSDSGVSNLRHNCLKNATQSYSHTTRKYFGIMNVQSTNMNQTHIKVLQTAASILTQVSYPQRWIKG